MTARDDDEEDCGCSEDGPCARHGEDDGECYCGGEAAAALRDSQAEAQALK